MRPRIRPLLARIWRDAQTLQIGADPQYAVVLAGVDPAVKDWMSALDGTRTAEAALSAAESDGLGRARAERLLALLAEHGLIEDAGADQSPWRRLPPRERARLAPDLAAAALVHDDRDAGAGLLTRRQAATVRVHGAGRVGAGIVALLAAAGVGALQVEDPGQVEPADLAPGGLGPDALGQPRAQAAAGRAGRINPAATARAVPADAARPGVRRPVDSDGRGWAAVDLAVLCGAGATDPVLAATLTRAGIPHLPVTIGEARVVLGPLVLPGASACVRCCDLARAERDRRWAHVTAQLCRASRRTAVPVDGVLASAAAARAAAGVLCLLDGGRPDLLDATVEIDLPDLASRRRTWQMHPACGCGWAEQLTASG